MLKKRFATLKQPVRLLKKHDLKKIMTTCIILHNMISEFNHENPDDDFEYHDLEVHLDQLDSEDAENEDVDSNEEVTNDFMAPRQYHTYVRNYVARYKAIRDTEIHDQVKKDLIDHLWNCYGEIAE